MAWYQCMLNFGMVQRMSHYIMVPMHITLLHDTYAHHTMEWYQIMACYITYVWHDSYVCHTMECMLNYGIVPNNTCYTIASIWHQCMSHNGMVLK